MNWQIDMLPELDFFFSEFDDSCKFTCEIMDSGGEFLDVYKMIWYLMELCSPISLMNTSLVEISIPL